MLFIALAVQRDQCSVVAVGEGEHRAGGGNQRRRLIGAAVEAPEDPVEFRDAYRRTNPGCSVILYELPLEACLAQPREQREPVGCFEVVSEVLLDRAAVGGVGLRDRQCTAAVVEDGAKEIAIPLVEEVDAALQGVARDLSCGGDLPSQIVGGPVGSGCNRSVALRGVVVGLVVVEERCGLQHGGGVEGVQPGDLSESIGLPLDVAQAAGIILLVLEVVGLRVVGDLEEVVADLGDIADLVPGRLVEE